MGSVVPGEFLSVLLLIVLWRYSQICLCMSSSSLIALARRWWMSTAVENGLEIVGGGGVARSGAFVWVISGDVDIGREA